MSRTLADLMHPWKAEPDAPQGAETFESLRLGFLVLPEPEDLSAGYEVRVVTPFQSPLISAKRSAYARERVAWGNVPSVMAELRAAVDAELADIEARRKKPRARKVKA